MDAGLLDALDPAQAATAFENAGAGTVENRAHVRDRERNADNPDAVDHMHVNALDLGHIVHQTLGKRQADGIGFQIGWGRHRSWFLCNDVS